jgi:hypothetical protein
MLISQYGSGTIPGINQKASSKSSSSIFSIFSGTGNGLKKSGVKKCGSNSLSDKSSAEISFYGKTSGYVILNIV